MHGGVVRRVGVLLLTLMVAWLPAAAVTLENYENVRFGYAISFPVGAFKGQGESDNRDGQRFVSPDGKAILTVYGSHNVDDAPVKALLKTAMLAEKSVTFRRQKGNWFVLSGYRGDTIYYRKTIADNVLVTFDLVYPKAQRRQYRSIVHILSHTLRRTIGRLETAPRGTALGAAVTPGSVRMPALANPQ